MIWYKGNLGERGKACCLEEITNSWRGRAIYIKEIKPFPNAQLDKPVMVTKGICEGDVHFEEALESAQARIEDACCSLCVSFLED